MKTLKWNGEQWYIDNRSLWKRFRQWIIWIGGWELANGEGWSFRSSYDKKLWMKPYPISFFKSITFYGWGWEVVLFNHKMVWSRDNGFCIQMKNRTETMAQCSNCGDPIPQDTRSQTGPLGDPIQLCGYCDGQGIDESHDY